MSEPSITIRPETSEDAIAIERLIARTFGPGRYVRSAFRIREKRNHIESLSFTAWIGTLLVGSVRVTPVLVNTTPALFLGPLTVEPPFRSKGIGSSLLKKALEEAKAQNHTWMLLIGDAHYYSKVGFIPAPKGSITMPGPVDPARILMAQLKENAGGLPTGAIRPNYDLPPT